MNNPQKYSRKLSEVFLEFVLNIVSENAPPEVFEGGVQLGMLLWNLGLLPEEEQLEEFEKVCATLGCEKEPEVKAQLARVFMMRRLLYGDDRRMICSYELVREQDSIQLLVASIDMGREPERKDNA